MFFWYILTLTSAQDCLPKCSWQCDSPQCPALCLPICEPPACHSSCTAPNSALCDVRCAKPHCQIKCPEEPCVSSDCPKCFADCEEPDCVTHCKAPAPECQVICEEIACSWQCHKPQCPKPKCELVCENPHCAPQLECCKCNEDTIPLTQEVKTLFAATEADANCCSCGNHQAIVGAPGETHYRKVAGVQESHEGVLQGMLAKSNH